MARSGFLWRLSRSTLFRLALPVRGMTLGVRALVFDENGCVLLVRHGYTPGWHLPGGGVDRDETAEQAARRELEEETGYRAEGASQLFGFYYNPKVWRGDHVALFCFSHAEKTREFAPNREIREIGWYHPDKLPEGVTPSTRARLGEVLEGVTRSQLWS